jgi:hypothetical protein
MAVKTTIENYIGYEIIGNGHIITFDLAPVKIKLESSNSGMKAVLYLIFKIGADDSKADAHVETKVEGDEFTLTLHNYNNPLGTGSRRPIPIGHLAGQQFFMHFRVYSFDADSDKLIFFTFYIKKSTVRLKKARQNGKSKK